MAENSKGFLTILVKLLPEVLLTILIAVTTHCKHLRVWCSSEVYMRQTTLPLAVWGDPTSSSCHRWSYECLRVSQLSLAHFRVAFSKRQRWIYKVTEILQKMQHEFLLQTFDNAILLKVALIFACRHLDGWIWSTYKFCELVTRKKNALVDERECGAGE